MKRADPRVSRLLGWYPRGWRERYGEEFVALLQDTLDGRRPTWRLRIGVALAGLRERAHHAARTFAAAASRPGVPRWLRSAMIGGIVALVPANLKASFPPAPAWQGTAALDALLAVAAFTCAAVLAGALIGVPAFVRFLRAGGWPKVRRRITWASAATVLAGGGLAGLLLAQHSMTYAQLSRSPGYWAGELTASLALVVALGLWVSTVTGLRKDLKLSPRARAAEVVLGAVIPVAASVTVWAYLIWFNTVQLLGPWLLVAVGGLALTLGGEAPPRIWRAVRRSRRILAAASRGR